MDVIPWGYQPTDPTDEQRRSRVLYLVALTHDYALAKLEAIQSGWTSYRFDQALTGLMRDGAVIETGSTGGLRIGAVGPVERVESDAA